MLTTKNLEYQIFESEMHSVLNYIENNVIELEKIIMQNEAAHRAKVLEEIQKTQLAIHSMDSELDILDAENHIEFLEESFNAFKSFPLHMLYKSQFFLTFSYFESSLILLHKICYWDLKKYLQESNRSIDNLEKAKGFFVNSLGVKWNNLNNFWTELKLYKNFRNHFIHNSFLMSDRGIRSDINISDNKFEQLSQNLNRIPGITLNKMMTHLIAIMTFSLLQIKVLLPG